MNGRVENHARLTALVALGDQVLATRRSPPPNVIGDFRVDQELAARWVTRVDAALSSIFGSASAYHAQFRRFTADHISYSDVVKAHGVLHAAVEDLATASESPGSDASRLATSTKVFVVHGHDDGLKTEVENFIHQIGLEPVVLHRQPDEGQTIIEKFERHSDVGYAFILLTADEVAYTNDQAELSDESRKTERRARPNVIFEFGYFVAKLGRRRVCCLHKGDVVLPTDLGGLVYKKVDGPLDSQKFSIVQELKAAGYRIRI